MLSLKADQEQNKLQASVEPEASILSSLHFPITTGLYHMEI